MVMEILVFAVLIILSFILGALTSNKWVERLIIEDYEKSDLRKYLIEEELRKFREKQNQDKDKNKDN